MTFHLDRKLIPAVPTWFSKDDDGWALDLSLNTRYVKNLIDEPIGGIATLVHTGRGNYLSLVEKESYLKSIVPLCHKNDKIVIMGARSEADARLARKMNVDMILIFPNREQLVSLYEPDRAAKIIKHHEKMMAIYDSGCVFLLYEETGVGIKYTLEEISAIFEIPGIKAIKFALLSNFELYEDLLSEIYYRFHNVAIFSGEDRMFAESLEKCRDLAMLEKKKDDLKINALVGLGVALPYLQSFILKAFDKPRLQPDYFRARALISALARACFTRPRKSGHTDYSLPMEPYISNVGYASAIQFKMPNDAVPDLARIPGEREKRGISNTIISALENHDFSSTRKKIELLINSGLKLEMALKKKYGYQLEKMVVKG
ncbi:MAG: hypothetical protein ACTSRA_05780 [Promethearchaeota archaeon]